MSGKVVRAADVCGVPKPPQLSAVEPTPPTFSEAGWFPWRLRNPLPCSRWAQHPGTSTDMASSLRTPSFTSCSSSSTDTDDDDGVRGTCKDASMCRGACGARGPRGRPRGTGVCGGGGGPVSQEHACALEGSRQVVRPGFHTCEVPRAGLHSWR